MWRKFTEALSTPRTRRPSRLPRRQRGFTLIEAIVSLILLVAVMMLAMTLLFTFRTFAERQVFNTTPRQAARRAVDYLGIYGAGAGDLNITASQVDPLGNAPKTPNALVMFYNADPADKMTRKQASYDNLPSGSTFGDEGTDILSLTIPVSPVGIDAGAGNLTWPQNPSTTPFQIFLNYQVGCPSNRNNLDRFKLLTGAAGTPPTSAPLILVDGEGTWQYVRITDYKDDDLTNPSGSVCSNVGLATPDNVIHVELGPVTEDAGHPARQKLDTPHGHVALAGPKNNRVRLMTGLQNIAFRVKDKALQQKTGFGRDGLFDQDDPDTGFTTVLDNVEDFQVAYLYSSDGSFRNSATSSLSTATPYPNGVPLQSGPCAVGGTSCDAANSSPLQVTDVINVVGLRFTVIGRSNPLPLASIKISERPNLTTGFHVRPAAENHAAPTVLPGGTLVYDYYRITSTLAVRNRLLEEPK